MPDIGSIPVLDVFVGLAFLYFVLSIVCSTASELLASMLHLRAKTLEAGVRALLGSEEASDEFFKNWKIGALGTPKWTTRDKVENSRKPSYIDPRTVSEVILDTFAPPSAIDAAKDGSEDVLAELSSKLDGTDASRGKEWLAGILEETEGHRDATRARLEKDFDEVMERASGWYKRKVQIILFCIALAVAGGLNADTINVADRLARDDAVRAQVVAQAQKTEAPDADGNPKTAPTAKDVEAQIAAARATALPLGWVDENIPDYKIGWIVAEKIAGLLLTAFALMAGGPFWFDVLGKVSRVRSSGKRPQEPAGGDKQAAARTKST